MDNLSHGLVVAQRQQLLPAGIARVPAAQRRGRLVGEHDIVLGVVENGLGGQGLLARGARARVRNQAA